MFKFPYIPLKFFKFLFTPTIYCVIMINIELGVVYSMNDEILTVAQTASYLKVSDKTVLKLIKSGKLVASLVGRIYRIKLSDINAYLAATSNEKERAKLK